MFLRLSQSKFKSTRALLPTHTDKIRPRTLPNHEQLFLRKIEDLERFLRVVSSQQEFWGEFVFDFFLIPAEYLITLLDERERFFNQPKSMIYKDMRKRHDSYVMETTNNRMSGMTTTRMEFDEEIEVEERSGSISSMQEAALKSQNFQFIDNYIKKGRGDTQLLKSDSAISNQSKRISFIFQVANWTRTVNGFIEYKIIVQYLEGSKPQTWEIYRRYSDFQELAHLLSEEYKGKLLPTIPLKLNGKKLTDDLLNGRQQQLEVYLNDLVAIKPIPKKLLEFIEYKTDEEGYENMGEMRVAIRTSDIVIDFHQKAKVHFNLDLSSGVTLQKTYKNFKILNHQLQATFKLQDEELYNELPAFPSKLSARGGKQSSDYLCSALENYLNTILSNPNLCHLLLVKSFLSPPKPLSSPNADDTDTLLETSPQGLINHTINDMSVNWGEETVYEDDPFSVTNSSNKTQQKQHAYILN